MKLELNPRGCYVSDGKFDQYEALKDVGVRAALCFKKQKPSDGNNRSDIRRYSLFCDAGEKNGS